MVIMNASIMTTSIPVIIMSATIFLKAINLVGVVEHKD